MITRLTEFSLLVALCFVPIHSIGQEDESSPTQEETTSEPAEEKDADADATEEEEVVVEEPHALDRDMLSVLSADTPWTNIRLPRYSKTYSIPPGGETPIPYYDLKFVLVAEEMIRENSEEIRLEEMNVGVFNDDEINMRVITNVAVFNVEDQKMRSRTPATIEHEQFVMTGDKMTFDTVNQTGTLEDNVVFESFSGAVPLPAPPAGNP